MMKAKILMAIAGGLLLATPAASDEVRTEKHAAAVAGPDAALDPASIYQLESQWTRADGQSMALRDLRGKVRVLAIFYSSCESACPMTLGRMKSVQARIPDPVKGDVGFVLVSMDAKHDDPARLREYAKRNALEGDWTLLKGSEEDVRELAALLGFRYREEKDGEFAHSNMITVLDREGRVAKQSIGLESDVNDAVGAVTSLLGAEQKGDGDEK